MQPRTAHRHQPACLCLPPRPQVADPEDGCGPIKPPHFDGSSLARDAPWIALLARTQDKEGCTFDVKARCGCPAAGAGAGLGAGAGPCGTRRRLSKNTSRLVPTSSPAAPCRPQVAHAEAAGAVAAVVRDDVYEPLILMAKDLRHPDPAIPAAFVSQRVGWCAGWGCCCRGQGQRQGRPSLLECRWPVASGLAPACRQLVSNWRLPAVHAAERGDDEAAHGGGQELSDDHATDRGAVAQHGALRCACCAAPGSRNDDVLCDTARPPPLLRGAGCSLPLRCTCAGPRVTRCMRLSTCLQIMSACAGFLCVNVVLGALWVVRRQRIAAGD